MASGGLVSVWTVPAGKQPDGLSTVDPFDVAWVHVVVSHLSRPTRRVEMADDDAANDRAAVTLRTLLLVAAQRPWAAVFDCSAGMRSTQGGAVWSIVRGSLEDLGYHVQDVTL
jgi:hypothetical protein